MIDYADYEFYVNTYKGSLSDDLFSSLIPKASRLIDKAINREFLTQEDLDDLEALAYKVRFVACELVDLLYSENLTSDSNGGTVSSISIDSVSKTYVTKSTDEVATERLEILSGLPHELTRFV